MVSEFAFGKSQPRKQDNLFRISVCPGNFPVRRTKKTFTIYIPTGGISRNLYVVNGKQPQFPNLVPDPRDEVDSFLHKPPKLTIDKNRYRREPITEVSIYIDTSHFIDIDRRFPIPFLGYYTKFP